MQTQILDETQIEEAGRILKEGGLVAFPTETVYGLGGDALNADASRKIYAAKGRPSDNPLIVHIARIEDLPPLVQEIPKTARLLSEAFWPGPLTMIFRKSDLVPDTTTGGLDTVAVRYPSNEIAQKMILAGGGYVAAPSANLSGKPSTTKASHVIHDLEGKVEAIIDGGDSCLGLESTIIDTTVDPPMILRPGFVTREMAEKVVGPVEIDWAIIDENSKTAPRAPGMKYRHYAPKADLILLKGTAEAVDRRMAELEGIPEVAVIPPMDVEKMANELYDRLRQCDESNVTTIYAAAYEEDGLGMALMNRMLKAAGYRMEEVK